MAGRIAVVRNKNYTPDGLKSYVWLLQKYNINPTMDGPYFRMAGHSGAYHDNTRHGGLKALRRHNHKHHHKDLTGAPSATEKIKAVADSAKAAVTGSLSYFFGNDRASPAANPAVNAATPTTDTATASVPAEDQQNDSLYLSAVQIGGQTVNLDFDTGSSDLWVMSTHLDASTQAKLKQNGHNIYDPSKASLLKGSTWSIEYGDGSSASGDVVLDTLKLGTISIPDQAIECAKKLDQAFIENAGDGLLGLAMGAINTVKPKRVKTPVENLSSEGLIPTSAQLFTAYLSSWKDTDEADKGQSFYTFGSVDQATLERCNATDFYWTPLVNQSVRGFWEFSSTSLSINGTVTKRDATKQKGGNTAIADTGTTLALVDDATCAAIYNTIEGAHYDYDNQGWVFPTNTPEDKLPDVGLDVGGKLFQVPKEALLFAETKKGTCYGGIQSRGDLSFDILGDTWLKGVYVCFDQGNKRFGCVQRTIESQNLAVRS